MNSYQHPENHADGQAELRERIAQAKTAIIEALFFNGAPRTHDIVYTLRHDGYDRKTAVEAVFQLRDEGIVKEEPTFETQADPHFACELTLEAEEAVDQLANIDEEEISIEVW